jgi:2-polyprenyl-6-hydroxyphenyl methylase/3-demethylubiquinone-9 3-methyltransferase
MIKRVLRRAGIEASHRSRKLLSRVTPYRPMGQGQHLLDTQYASAEWDYLRNIEEAPRFGIVSAYCRLLASGGSLLEVGCGEGFLLEQLDRSRYRHFTGIDISEVAIERARALEDDRTVFVRAEAESYVPDRTFEVIVFNEVLEYFDEPLELVRRYEPFLAPGGHLVASMFAAPYTARSQRIWKMLESRYEVVAHSRVRVARDYQWNIKVLRVPASS